MSKYFGKTWWGKQWLNALHNIDYGNRLPRGSSYANKGAVKSLAVDGNQIIAKVQGSRPSPYKVSISVPVFPEQRVKDFIKQIADRPAYISKLLNRELDPGLLEIANNMGLAVFPKTWNDLPMDCSCPDWAVPCKHLAAVIYMVSREIDNNPFLVFQLHKVDLLELLKPEGIDITPNTENEVPSLADFLKSSTGSKTKTVDFEEDKAYTFTDINFPVKSIQNALLSLLPSHTSFHPKDNFKEQYGNLVEKTAKQAENILLEKSPINLLFSSLGKHGNKPFSLHHSDECVLVLDGNFQCEISHDKQKLSIDFFLEELWQIPPAHVKDYHPSVAAFRKAAWVALGLLARGAVVPQIIFLKDNDYTIQWLPALLDKQVKELVETLEKAIPPSCMVFKSGKEELLIQANQAQIILSLILNSYISNVHYNTTFNDDFLSFFFKIYADPYDGISEQSIPGAIKVWLSRYYLSQGQYTPVLAITEAENEQFELEVAVQDQSTPMTTPVKMEDIWNDEQLNKSKFSILQSLNLISPFIPGLNDYINQKGKSRFLFSRADFGPFLINMIPALRLLDIQILLPKTLQHLLKPKPTVRVTKKEEQSSGFLRLDKLLGFEWQVALGDHVISKDEFSKLVRETAGLLKYKSSYVYIDPADLEKLNKHLIGTKPLSAIGLLQAALSESYEGAKVTLDEDVQKLINELRTVDEVPLPVGLQATLRPYQQRGYSWMFKNTRIGFGSIIADDMGLGKTLQVITTILKYKEEGYLDSQKVLVIAPTSLLTNWQKEIEKFAPDLSVQLYHGNSRNLDKKNLADVILTTYGMVRRDASELKKLKWHAIVTDEAQNIKNNNTDQTKAVKSLPANTYIAMSGTPVENRLSEFWSIMDFCNRGYLGNQEFFRKSFGIPIQNKNDREALQQFKQITAPFIMRRMKSDKSIIADLPDKIERDTYCSLTKEQTALYESTLAEAMKAIEAIDDTDHQSLFKRQGLVLQMILALKQICNHPSNYLKNRQNQAALSGKSQMLIDTLETIDENNEKVLIFTQFHEMGEILREQIHEKFDQQALFYHGGCSIKQRQEMVDRFQNSRSDRFFILSLKAAGTGLNLTAASHVIHYDLWWNPAVEAQATDRAYRIGQHKNVVVHRFITKGTFEERINEMIQSKKQLAEMTVSTGENWIGNLSNKQLKSLFVLEKEQVI